jgi:hypothetical protein
MGANQPSMDELKKWMYQAWQDSSGKVLAAETLRDESRSAVNHHAQGHVREQQVEATGYNSRLESDASQPTIVDDTLTTEHKSNQPSRNEPIPSSRSPRAKSKSRAAPGRARRRSSIVESGTSSDEDSLTPAQCWFSSANIDLVVLATHLKELIDDTATIKAAPHPNDPDKAGYIVGAKKVLQVPNLQDTIADSRSFEREKTVREYRRDPYSYEESDTWYDRKKGDATPALEARRRPRQPDAPRAETQRRRRLKTIHDMGFLDELIHRQSPRAYRLRILLIAELESKSLRQKIPHDVAAEHADGKCTLMPDYRTMSTYVSGVGQGQVSAVPLAL